MIYSIEFKKRNNELERENAELKRAKDILKVHSAFSRSPRVADYRSDEVKNIRAASVYS
ncbi:MAG: hypothetical protein VB118_02830 [Oscillospiraceae bacterium]|nr:hypothetical protein [Oscillospiraceae bacterium]